MRQILLLRGINLGPNNRVAMPALRALLTDAGFEDVATYLQSGNVIVSSKLSPDRAARRCEGLLSEHLGLDVAVLARTHEQLAEVVRRNPLGDVADDPKRYQVSFLSAEPDSALVERIAALAAPGEQLVAEGRELYAWHPGGIARSKLWARLAKPGNGLVASARNWRTVTSLLELSSP